MRQLQNDIITPNAGIIRKAVACMIQKYDNIVEIVV